MTGGPQAFRALDLCRQHGRVMEMSQRAILPHFPRVLAQPWGSVGCPVVAPRATATVARGWIAAHLEAASDRRGGSESCPRVFRAAACERGRKSAGHRGAI